MFQVDLKQSSQAQMDSVLRVEVEVVTVAEEEETATSTGVVVTEGVTEVETEDGRVVEEVLEAKDQVLVNRGVHTNNR